MRSDVLVGDDGAGGARRDFCDSLARLGEKIWSRSICRRTGRPRSTRTVSRWSRASGRGAKCVMKAEFSPKKRFLFSQIDGSAASRASSVNSTITSCGSSRETTLRSASA